MSSENLTAEETQVLALSTFSREEEAAREKKDWAAIAELAKPFMEAAAGLVEVANQTAEMVDEAVSAMIDTMFPEHKKYEVEIEGVEQEQNNEVEVSLNGQNNEVEVDKQSPELNAEKDDEINGDEVENERDAISGDQEAIDDAAAAKDAKTLQDLEEKDSKDHERDTIDGDDLNALDDAASASAAKDEQDLEDSNIRDTIYPDNKDAVAEAKEVSDSAPKQTEAQSAAMSCVAALRNNGATKASTTTDAEVLTAPTARSQENMVQQTEGKGL